MKKENCARNGLGDPGYFSSRYKVLIIIIIIIIIISCKDYTL
jgi:hypothetical protein